MTELTPALKEKHRYAYDYESSPYDTPEGRSNAPQWLKDELAARAVHRNGTPQYAAAPKPPEVFPDAPVAGAVPKQAALYALLGLVVPGVPSLLLRKDKMLGIVQIVAGIVALILIIVLIGLIAYPGVAIWSAVTGYQDAQLWNRRHGFIT
jgi:hypothetical protein